MIIKLKCISTLHIMMTLILHKLESINCLPIKNNVRIVDISNMKSTAITLMATRSPVKYRGSPKMTHNLGDCENKSTKYLKALIHESMQTIIAFHWFLHFTLSPLWQYSWKLIVSNQCLRLNALILSIEAIASRLAFTGIARKGVCKFTVYLEIQSIV